MSTSQPVNAILVGGPDTISPQDRLTHVPDAGDDDLIKLRHAHGCDHFERTSEQVAQDGHTLRVYAWSQFTKTAE